METSKKIEILERALIREKNARKRAEAILEKKSTELYNISEALKVSNKKLADLLKEKTNELEGVFINIVDAYVLIDLKGNVLKMNEAAIHLLGFDYRTDNVNLLDLVAPKYIEYTKNAFKTLYNEGVFTNYQAVIRTNNKVCKLVQINASVIYNPEGKPIAAQGIARDITEETKLKKQHEEQKRQLDIIMDNSPVGISLSTSNFKNIILANTMLTSILGYSKQELGNIDPKKLTYYKDRKKSSEYIDGLIQGKINSYAIEKRYVKKNGELIWVKTSASAVRDENDKMIYQVATVEDISKEKAALEKLKESENRLATLIVNLQNGILLEDENRKLLLTNQRFCKMFGLKTNPEDLIGLDGNEVIDKYKNSFTQPEEFISKVNTLLEHKENALNDELFLKDGRVLERNYIPIYHDNMYKGHLWTYTDVTIHKKYKESLKAQKEKYSSIITNMNLGVLENNLEDKIIFSNQSFCEMSGYSQEELLGKKAVDLFLTQKSSEKYYRRVKQRELNQPDSYELAVKNKEGEIRHWLISTAPNYNLKGNKIGSIGIHLDITQIKELEKQKEILLTNLEKQNEQLNEYAHIVSHDLKSPLRNISALLSWTKEDFEEKLGKESLTNLDLMQSKVEKMDLLIENILKYSSIDSDILVEENIDLNHLIHTIKELIYIPKDIELKITSNLPTIKADKTRIQQVFQNLISNAANYIEKEHGLIEIDYSETKTHYIFSVKDNGVGIAKEHHEKIFKIFSSLSNSEKSTGIGLSIVKKVVDLYKGKVWLESEVNVGTTFFFSIEK